MRKQQPRLTQLVIGASTLIAAGLTSGTGIAAGFAYSGDHGPGFWHETPGWEACGGASSSARQSPIDIRNAQYDWRLRPLTIYSYPTQVQLINNGHTIEQEYENGTALYLDNAHFELLQFHFHTFSEHAVDGDYAELEMHAVFRNGHTGALAVVGKQFETGGYNPFLQTLINAGLPEQSGDHSSSGATINLADALGDTSSYYTYQGSLTTPPCSEIVTWFVLEDIASLSAQQFDAFRDILGNNFRPLQDPNGRVVYTTD